MFTYKEKVTSIGLCMCLRLHHKNNEELQFKNRQWVHIIKKQAKSSNRQQLYPTALSWEYTDGTSNSSEACT